MFVRPGQLQAAFVCRHTPSEHLSDFRLDVEAWLRERAGEGRAERAKLERDTARLRAAQAKVVRRAEQLQASLDSALDAGDRRCNRQR